MARNCKCPHLDNVLQLSLSELCKAKQGKSCSKCDTYGPNLWICLYKTCLQIGCSEQYNDHSTKHFTSNEKHCVHMNLSSQRIWCYVCKTEVFLQQTRRNSLISNDSNDTNRYSGRVAIFERSGGGGGGGVDSAGESSGEDDELERHSKLSGLIGLQNIANTCYMNAALQALSNTPPLTGYLLNCGDIIEANIDLTHLNCQRKTGLARSYHRLVKDMWCRNQRTNGYLVPSGILNGIRSVHPMFRGYQQHDTQEFLRCFMDQLHEELKEITPPPPDASLKTDTDNDDDIRSECSSTSQSEIEYETCDSNISEESSLSGDIPLNPAYTQQQHQRYSRSPSPISSSNQSLLITQTSFNNSFTNVGTNTTTTTSSSTLKESKDATSSKQPHRSIISDVFDGKLLSSVQCLTCNRISTRTETFQDLSLPIPSKDHLTVLHQSQNIVVQQPTGVTCTDAVYQAAQLGWFAWLTNWIRSLIWGPAVSLHDCMAAFFSADELKGDNMYSCEKCNKLRNGIKFSRVLELPEMLCVHLKRFRHDLSYSSKITSPVNFPLKGFDMSSYLHKDCKSNVATYDLTAIICHHGTAGGGHYTCFAKHQLSGKWYEYDDQLVTEVAEEVVQNCEAYVLFYRKSNLIINHIREQAQQVELSAEQAAADISFYISKQWLNKFNTFAEPGPIDNWALLCAHGALPPSKAKIKTQLLVALPQPLWDFLYQKFGGGPALNHLYECDICLRAAELLARRQTYELEAFQMYRDEMSSTSTIYAISMPWLRQWQLFIGGVSSDEPGPINNTSILCQNENGTRTVKPGSDYAQITASLWKFSYGIYGGGPEIILRGAQTEENREQHKLKNEMDALTLDSCTQPLIEIPSNKTIYSEQIMETTNELSHEQHDNSHVPLAHKKIVKNVSFENDDNFNEKDTPSGGGGGGGGGGVSYDGTNSKRTKQQHQSNSKLSNNIGNSEIVSRRDKRYHSDMATNGLFGPDGTYSDHSQYNNIPSDDLANNMQQAISSSTTLANSTTTNKRIQSNDPIYNYTLSEEVVHLLGQKMHNSSMPDTDINSSFVTSTTNATTAKDLQSRKLQHNRNTYRKKMKIKSNRKLASTTTTSTTSTTMHSENYEVSLSDSDKN